MAIGFGIACLAFGAAIAAWAWGQWRGERRRRRWPTVRGRLIERGRVELDASGWRLRPRYEYSVDGKRFENDQWRSQPSSRFHFPGQARPALAAIAENPIVHFNPFRPSESFLEPTTLAPTACVLAFGAALGGAGVFVIVKLVACAALR